MMNHFLMLKDSSDRVDLFLPPSLDTTQGSESVSVPYTYLSALRDRCTYATASCIVVEEANVENPIWKKREEGSLETTNRVLTM